MIIKRGPIFKRKICENIEYAFTLIRALFSRTLYSVHILEKGENDAALGVKLII